MAQVYELSARYDARQSFYGKAHVIETPKKLRLQSYDTIVATWDKANKVLVVHPDKEYAPQRALRLYNVSPHSRVCKAAGHVVVRYHKGW